ncbi:MAG: hypothetical protein MET45_05820 [Nostoc sp. LLA-1]|nr:hypothetical protein [Cyanocohniella sp. LLY]
MKYRRPWHNFRGSWLLALMSVVIATPAIAESSHFGKFTLSPGFDPSTGIVQGQTGGAYSLSGISRRDRDRNLCIGFGDPQPDHILVLEENFDQLTVLVNSRGNDTTLLIQGPDNKTIRCGNGSQTSKDASLTDKNWTAGNYSIWVGTFHPRMRHNYTLTVQEN